MSNPPPPPFSPSVSEQYLPLLFTALEREGCAANRTTVLIALGDLAFRFPNALEPWYCPALAPTAVRILALALALTLAHLSIQ